MAESSGETNGARNSSSKTMPEASTLNASSSRLGFFKKNLQFLNNAMKRHEYLIYDVVLIGAFAALMVRVSDRQHQIDGLENQTESLQKENDSLKKRIWHLKQGFLREAADHSDLNLLSRLKVLFGEGTTQEEPDTTERKSKFLV
eukprot:TRINITY_DN8923_c0_g1_i1.p1 TRINITY_DN8923_c0_g1~~TRINITY_DN8923_c0_g1_i1.p1  ORF type:complete len:145 (-),score=28.60 TRINITY_DN8923_c0_g1_i1:249-683(-)